MTLTAIDDIWSKTQSLTDRQEYLLVLANVFRILQAYAVDTNPNVSRDEKNLAEYLLKAIEKKSGELVKHKVK